MPRRLRNLMIVCAAMLPTLTVPVRGAAPIFVGTGSGLYKSTDAGASWTMVNVPLSSPLLSGQLNVFAVRIDPHNPSKIYLIGLAKAWAFFATQDGGQTWTARPFVGMSPGSYSSHYALAVDFAGQVIYITAYAAGTSPQLYKSTDVGATWTKVAIPGFSITDFIVADPLISGTIYASDDFQFFKSTDFGGTWTKIGAGITQTSGGLVPQTSIENIKVDPQNPKIWYFGTNHSGLPSTCPLTNGGLCGLFKSTDGGATFTGLSIPINYVTSVSFGTVSSTIYATGQVAGLGPTVMRSTDSGSTWVPLVDGLFTAQSGEVWADPSDASTIYLDDAVYADRSFYVSTDGGATFPQRMTPLGPPTCVPGNCARQPINDLLFVPSGPAPYICANTTPPVISFVDSASAYGGYPYFASGSWLEIKGSNLADLNDPRLATGSGAWASSDFNGASAPTNLDGVSVSINGKPAYVWFLSPTQLNVQAPEDSTSGNVAITVTNCKAQSSLVMFARYPLAPGLLAPSNYSSGGTQYMVATFASDGAYVLNTSLGASFSLNSRPAKPGDLIVAYGIGFGDVTPSILPGTIVSEANQLVNPVTFSFGSTPATLTYSGLAGSFVGLYEFYITVPGGLANGDYQINVTQNGTAIPQTMYLTVHN